MVKKIGVFPELEAKVRSFLEREEHSLETVPPGEGMPVRIEEPAPGEACLPDRLFPKGWIACALALDMARNLEIPPGKMGRFLNLLEIKIRKCQLGCFG